MDIVTPAITEYMTGLLPERSRYHLEMEAYAREHNFPIIGPLVGTFLSQQAALIGAKKIMELGSGFGYSALWFSTVLPPDGRIICTDGDVQNQSRADAMFADLGLSGMVDFRHGNALEIFAGIDDEFDLIFCDIDKHEYPQAYQAALPKLRKGGVLAFDNSLWSGRMLEGDESSATKGVAELNRMAFSDSSVHASIVPIRDGVLVAWKK